MAAARRMSRSVGQWTAVAVVALGRSMLWAATTADNDPPPASASARRVDLLQALDVVAAAVLYGWTAAVLLAANDGPAGPLYPPVVVHLVAFACTAPVLARRRRPLVAWQVSLVAVVIASTAFSPLLVGETIVVPGGDVATVLCAYTVASRSAPRLGVGVLGWSLAALIVIQSGGRDSVAQDASTFGWLTASTVLALVAGSNVRARRRAQADLTVWEHRSERAQAERAVLEERSRIARELHDVVAHSMSVIAIKAEAAPLRAPDDPVVLRDELAEIRALALQSMTELRRVLGVLRDAGDADLAPAPGLEELRALLDTVTAAGGDVDMTVTGRARAVPSGVAVSVYRIVQESLSNALRHAPGAPVAVELTYRDVPPSLHVRVRNGPPMHAAQGRDHDGPRHGLIGMRERAAMLHGDLVATPTADGGYLVELSLPLEER